MAKRLAAFMPATGAPAARLHNNMMTVTVCCSQLVCPLSHACDSNGNCSRPGRPVVAGQDACQLFNSQHHEPSHRNSQSMHMLSALTLT